MLSRPRFQGHRMDMHKNGRLTPLEREQRVRLIESKQLLCSAPAAVLSGFPAQP